MQLVHGYRIACLYFRMMSREDSSDAIAELLTNRQHLRPHLGVREVLDHVIAELGCCPIAIDRATEWLSLDTNRLIGRLRRSELLQLARSVDRYWHANPTATDTSGLKPAATDFDSMR